MKRKWAMLLLLCVLFTGFTAWTEGAEARLTSGDYVYELQADGSARIVRYTGEDDRIAVPAELDGHPVSEIGGETFWRDEYYDPSMVAIQLPEGLKRLEHVSAFWYNDNLVWVSLPASLESIGMDDDWSRESELHFVVVRDSWADRFFSERGIPVLYADEYGDPETVEMEWTDDDYCYYALGDGPAKILSWYGNEARVVVPAAFNGHALETIADYAFYYGPGDSDYDLKSVVLPEGLKAIGADAFACRYGLRSVEIPEGLESLGDGAFSSCIALESIQLPDSLTHVGANPFAGCDALQRIEISRQHPCFEVADGALYGKADHRLIGLLPQTDGEAIFRVREGTEIIGRYAFDIGHDFDEIALPASVTCFEEDALPMLARLVVPAGSYAEQYCIDMGYEYRVEDAAG